MSMVVLSGPAIPVLYAIRAPSGENVGPNLGQVILRELYRLSVGKKLDVNLPRTEERTLPPNERKHAAVR